MEATKKQCADWGYVHSVNVTPSSPEPGVTRRVGATNDKMMIVEHRFEKGWVGTPHAHPHEQAVYVVSGHMKVTCGTETFELHGGDSFVVRGNVEHQAAALEESILIDIFTPYREDYV